MTADLPGALREGGAEPANRRALRDFLHDEALGGVVLLLAASVAVVWANSTSSASYFAMASLPGAPMPRPEENMPIEWNSSGCVSP